MTNHFPGAHQFQPPSSRMVAGTSGVLTTVAPRKANTARTKTECAFDIEAE